MNHKTILVLAVAFILGALFFIPARTEASSVIGFIGTNATSPQQQSLELEGTTEATRNVVTANIAETVVMGSVSEAIAAYRAWLNAPGIDQATFERRAQLTAAEINEMDPSTLSRVCLNHPELFSVTETSPLVFWLLERVWIPNAKENLSSEVVDPILAWFWDAQHGDPLIANQIVAKLLPDLVTRDARVLSAVRQYLDRCSTGELTALHPKNLLHTLFVATTAPKEVIGCEPSSILDDLLGTRVYQSQWADRGQQVMVMVLIGANTTAFTPELVVGRILTLMVDFAANGDTKRLWGLQEGLRQYLAGNKVPFEKIQQAFESLPDGFLDKLDGTTVASWFEMFSTFGGESGRALLLGIASSQSKYRALAYEFMGVNGLTNPVEALSFLRDPEDRMKLGAARVLYSLSLHDNVDAIRLSENAVEDSSLPEDTLGVLLRTVAEKSSEKTRKGILERALDNKSEAVALAATIGIGSTPEGEKKIREIASSNHPSAVVCQMAVMETLIDVNSKEEATVFLQDVLSKTGHEPVRKECQALLTYLGISTPGAPEIPNWDSVFAWTGQYPGVHDWIKFGRGPAFQISLKRFNTP